MVPESREPDLERKAFFSGSGAEIRYPRFHSRGGKAERSCLHLLWESFYPFESL